jgi:hypothetical protein
MLHATSPDGRRAVKPALQRYDPVEPERQTHIQLFRDGGLEAAGGILNRTADRSRFCGLALECAATC